MSDQINHHRLSVATYTTPFRARRRSGGAPAKQNSRSQALLTASALNRFGSLIARVRGLVLRDAGDYFRGLLREQSLSPLESAKDFLGLIHNGACTARRRTPLHALVRLRPWP